MFIASRIILSGALLWFVFAAWLLAPPLWLALALNVFVSVGAAWCIWAMWFHRAFK